MHSSRSIPRKTHFVYAEDGTRIAWHAHFEPGQHRHRPLLLLTNGIGTTADFWRHFIGKMRHDHRVVQWDYRGHGASENARSDDYSMPTQAQDLARVCTAAMRYARTEEEPAHACFSMGVLVALELYRVRPELSRGFVFLAGGANAPRRDSFPFTIPGVSPITRLALAALTPFVSPATPLVRAVLAAPGVYELLRGLGLVRSHAPRADVARMLEDLGAMDPRAVWLTLRALTAARAEDVLPSITVPSLIVGAAHDHLVPDSEIAVLRRGIPHARFLQITNAGHANLIEAGPEVASVVRAFLATLPHRPHPNTTDDRHGPR